MIWTVVDSARESRPSRMRLVLFVRDLRSAVRKARTERELDELIKRHSLASEEFELHYAHDALALADRAGRDERRRDAAVAWARRVVTSDFTVAEIATEIAEVIEGARQVN